jgi:hypothetical protein
MKFTVKGGDSISLEDAKLFHPYGSVGFRGWGAIISKEKRTEKRQSILDRSEFENTTVYAKVIEYSEEFDELRIKEVHGIGIREFKELDYHYILMTLLEGKKHF